MEGLTRCSQVIRLIHIVVTKTLKAESHSYFCFSNVHKLAKHHSLKYYSTESVFCMNLRRKTLIVMVSYFASEKICIETDFLMQKNCSRGSEKCKFCSSLFNLTQVRPNWCQHYDVYQILGTDSLA